MSALDTLLERAPTQSQGLASFQEYLNSTAPSEPRRSSGKKKKGKKKGLWEGGFLSDVLEAVTLPLAAVTSTAKEIGDLVEQIDDRWRPAGAEPQSASFSDWWKQFTSPEDQIHGRDILAGNEDKGITQGVFTQGEQGGALPWQPPSKVTTGLGFALDVALDPLSYVTGAGAIRGAEAAAAHLTENVAQKIAKAAGRELDDDAIKRIMSGDVVDLAAMDPKIVASVEAIRTAGSEAVHAARRGGASALSDSQLQLFGGAITEGSERVLKKGLQFKLPGMKEGIRVTTGRGPLSQLSVGQHRLRSGLGDVVLGGGGKPAKLGTVIGDAELKSVARSGNPLEMMNAIFTKRTKDTAQALSAGATKDIANWGNQARKGFTREQLIEAARVIDGDEAAKAPAKLVANIRELQAKIGKLMVDKNVVDEGALMTEGSYFPSPITPDAREALQLAGLAPPKELAATYARSFAENRRVLWDSKTGETGLGRDVTIDEVVEAADGTKSIVPRVVSRRLDLGKSATRAEAEKKAADALATELEAAAKEPGSLVAVWLAENPDAVAKLRDGSYPLFHDAEAALAAQAQAVGRRVGEAYAGRRMYSAGVGSLDPRRGDWRSTTDSVLTEDETAYLAAQAEAKGAKATAARGEVGELSGLADELTNNPAGWAFRQILSGSNDPEVLRQAAAALGLEGPFASLDEMRAAIIERLAARDVTGSPLQAAVRDLPSKVPTSPSAALDPQVAPAPSHPFFAREVTETSGLPLPSPDDLAHPQFTDEVTRLTDNLRARATPAERGSLDSIDQMIEDGTFNPVDPEEFRIDFFESGANRELDATVHNEMAAVQKSALLWQDLRETVGKYGINAEPTASPLAGVTIPSDLQAGLEAARGTIQQAREYLDGLDLSDAKPTAVHDKLSELARALHLDVPLRNAGERIDRTNRKLRDMIEEAVQRADREGVRYEAHLAGQAEEAAYREAMGMRGGTMLGDETFAPGRRKITPETRKLQRRADTTWADLDPPRTAARHELDRVQQQIDEFQPVGPPDHTMPMNFAYGNEAREGITATTTFDAIVGGERTSTTRFGRYARDLQKVKAGDVVEFTAKDGRKVKVVVDGVRTVDPATVDVAALSQTEGWSEAYLRNALDTKGRSGAAVMDYHLVPEGGGRRAPTPLSTEPSPRLVRRLQSLRDEEADLMDGIEWKKEMDAIDAADDIERRAFENPTSPERIAGRDVQGLGDEVDEYGGTLGERLDPAAADEPLTTPDPKFQKPPLLTDQTSTELAETQLARVRYEIEVLERRAMDTMGDTPTDLDALQRQAEYLRNQIADLDNQIEQRRSVIAPSAEAGAAVEGPPLPIRTVTPHSPMDEAIKRVEESVTKVEKELGPIEPQKEGMTRWAKGDRQVSDFETGDVVFHGTQDAAARRADPRLLEAQAAIVRAQWAKTGESATLHETARDAFRDFKAKLDEAMPQSPERDAVAMAETQTERVGMMVSDPTQIDDVVTTVERVTEPFIVGPVETVSAERFAWASSLKSDVRKWSAVAKEAEKVGNLRQAEVARLRLAAAELAVSADLAEHNAATYFAKWEKAVDELAAGAGSDLLERGARDFHAYRSLAPGILTPVEVAEQITAFNKVVYTGAGASNLAKGYRQALHWMRVWQIASPGFHIRNMFGGVFNNALGDVDWRTYREVSSAWWKVRHGKTLTAKQQKLWDQVTEILTPGQIGSEGYGSPLGRLAGESKVSKNPLLSTGPITRTSEKFGGDVEFYLRSTLAWDVMKKGGSIEDATAAINKFHFDYGDLSIGERKVKENLIPFYTWTRHNLPLQMQQLVENPRVYARFQHARRTIEEQSEADPIIPGYFTDELAIRLPFTQDGGHKYIMPDLPFRDLKLAAAPFKMVAGEGDLGNRSLDALSDTVGQVTPLISGPVEWYLQRQFYHGIPIRSDRPVALKDLHIPKWLQGPMKLSGMVKLNKPTGKYYITERDLYLIDKLLPVYGRIRRLGGSEEDKMQDKLGGRLLSFFGGTQVRSNTQSDQEIANYLRSLDTSTSDSISKKLTEGYDPNKPSSLQRVGGAGSGVYRPTRKSGGSSNPPRISGDF